jgi:hypothetical protein
MRPGRFAYPGVHVTRRFPDLDALLTTIEAAQAVNVSAHAVRKWRTRGWDGLDGQRRKLATFDRDDQGRPFPDRKPRHRYRDVLDAERETHGSNKSHRRVGGPAPRDWVSLNLAS